MQRLRDSHRLNAMQDLGTSYAVKAQSQHTLVSRAFLLICAHEHVNVYVLSPLEVTIINCHLLSLFYFAEDHVDRRFGWILSCEMAA